MQFEIYKSIAMAEGDDVDEPILEVVVTEERNIFVVWQVVAKTMPKLVEWFYGHEREQSIEFAVDLARAMRSKLTTSKADGGLGEKRF